MDQPTDEQRCTAGSSRRPGERCKKWRVRGTTVCRTHGAAAPQVAAKATERVAEARVARTFAALADDPAPVVNPFEALSLLGGRVLQVEQIARGMLAELYEIRSTDAKGAEQVNALVSVYERALDRAGQLLVQMGKLDIDARLARIEEAKALVLVQALETTLTELGLSKPQREQARGTFARQLRAVS